MKLLLDVDGVIANNVDASLGIIADLTGRQYTEADVTHWDYGRLLDTDAQRTEFWRRFNAPGFCAGLQPYPGAIDAVKALMGEHDVVFVTSPSASLTWAGEREAWLKERLGANRKQIISTSGKHHVPGDVLVDDSVDHLDAWGRAWPKGSAVSWLRPYNRHYRAAFGVTNWGELDAVLKAVGGT